MKEKTYIFQKNRIKMNLNLVGNQLVLSFWREEANDQTDKKRNIYIMQQTFDYCI